MKGFGTAAASAAIVVLGGAGGAYAADLNSMPVKAVPIGSAVCSSIVDFFTTACQVSAYGVRFYGTIDMGVDYATHKTPLDPLVGPGFATFPVKNSGAHGGGFTLAPNGLSFSNIGLQIAEPLGGGWKFVGQLEAGFVPTSMELGDNAGSVRENAGLTLANQRLGADGGGDGKFYNLLGFAGVSHDTWGTLTWGRQNDIGKDMVFAYDSMGNSFALSYIGFFGATAGGGDTEDAKTTTALKYRVNIANWRLGAIVQTGDRSATNASDAMYQASFGGDFHIGPGVLSFDAMGGFTKDAVSLGLTGGALNSDGSANPLEITPQNEIATISNNTNVMVGGKYVVDRLKLYAGYEWIRFAAPSDRSQSFIDESGNLTCQGCLVNGVPTTVSVSTYDNGDKVQQTAWLGARYALTSQLDLAAAYYHADVSAFGAAPSAANGNVAGAIPTVCATNARGNGNCHGTADTVSFLLDYQFAPKWDTYLGTQYTKLGGSQANGFIVDNNWTTTAGLRFRW